MKWINKPCTCTKCTCVNAMERRIKTYLERERCPVPQVVEHSDQLPHGAHSQPIRTKEIKRKKKIINDIHSREIKIIQLTLNKN